MTLHDRFASPPPGAPSRRDCPEAERILLAATGRAPFDEVRALLDHVASCAACTVAWRVAREIEPFEAGKARPAPRATWRSLAAAAVVLVAVATTGLLLLVRPPSVAYRATGEAAIRAAIPDQAPLPRSAFVLRWTPGPPGTRYTVLVTDERLAPIAEGANLGVEELRVAESALAHLPAGARVLWQVRAVLPDGTRVTTPTLVARVGP